MIVPVINVIHQTTAVIEQLQQHATVRELTVQWSLNTEARLLLEPCRIGRDDQIATTRDARADGN